MNFGHTPYVIYLVQWYTSRGDARQSACFTKQARDKTIDQVERDGGYLTAVLTSNRIRWEHKDGANAAS